MIDNKPSECGDSLSIDSVYFISSLLQYVPSRSFRAEGYLGDFLPSFSLMLSACQPPPWRWSCPPPSCAGGLSHPPPPPSSPIGLTLSAAAADLAEESPLAQAVQPLLAYQLQQLRLQTLLQLSSGATRKVRHTTNTQNTHLTIGSHMLCNELYWYDM